MALPLRHGSFLNATKHQYFAPSRSILTCCSCHNVSTPFVRKFSRLSFQTRPLNHPVIYKPCSSKSFSTINQHQAELLSKQVPYTPNTAYLPTIYALSTQPGRSAIAVVRISGSECLNIYRILTRRQKLPKPRKIIYSTLYDPSTYSLGKNDEDAVLDKAVVLYFQGPKSYTGEDVLELQLHGGNAIVRAVLRALNKLGGSNAIEVGISQTTKKSFVDMNLGLRYAEAGEFSRRAFENGVLDLTQIEGIRDAIDADTELQRIASLPSFSGSFKSLYHSWRHQLVESVALLTALIDFSEDSGDVGESSHILFDQAKSKVHDLLNEIENFEKRVSRGALVKEGVKLYLLGQPNAGKSYLLNTIVEREAAIVSDIPGTTRDVLEVGMDIGGHKVVIGDTAGLRLTRDFDDTTDSIEQKIANSALKIEMEGIKRAKERFKQSDIILVVIPMDDPHVTKYIQTIGTNAQNLPEVSNDILEEIGHLHKLEKKIIVVLNKEDLLKHTLSQKSPSIDEIKSNLTEAYSKVLHVDSSQILFTSCLSQNGIDRLISQISSQCQSLIEDPSSTTGRNALPVVASERVRTIISHDIVTSLHQFLEIESDEDVVIAMEELKFAIDGIAKITGESVGVEEVLGVVFSNFCVGK